MFANEDTYVMIVFAFVPLLFLIAILVWNKAVRKEKKNDIKNLDESVEEDNKQEENENNKKQWVCVCGRNNDIEDKECYGCGMEKEEALLEKQKREKEKEQDQEIEQEREKTWECNFCGVENEEDARYCKNCGVKRDGIKSLLSYKDEYRRASDMDLLRRQEIVEQEKYKNVDKEKQWICKCGRINDIEEEQCYGCGATKPTAKKHDEFDFEIEKTKKEKSWTCYYCGKENDSKDEFCQNCGSRKLN